MVAHTLRAEGFDASEDGTGRGTPLVSAMNLRGREGGAMPEMSEEASLRASNGGSSRSYIAASTVRRLSPTECERLQSFPDGWTIPGEAQDVVDPQPDGPRYAAMGNAVTVNVVHWIGSRIVGYEEGRLAA
jgi:DNA (cytosine-5)-methyltransferase 1